MSIFRQLRQANTDFAPSCIFDVGANVGQTVRQIVSVYPSVPVHAFEPVSATFESLRSAVEPLPQVAAHRLALGSRPGRAIMRAIPGNVTNRILAEQPLHGQTEEVEVTTGDLFCAAQGVAEIGILKIDAEGHDLEVLVGFRGMLAERRCAYVQVECGIAPDNRMHVPFFRLADFMFALGYGLLALNGVATANLTTKRRDRGMWFGNAVFVAERWPEDAIPL